MSFVFLFLVLLAITKKVSGQLCNYTSFLTPVFIN
jgi:Na+-transporting methylmalonyl-CoA/oxaloacetate decarboxylase gamma subunit